MFRAIGRKLKNLKLRQRMLLVYAIGCFLPLILVTLIMFNSSRRSLTTMQINNEKDKLEEGQALIEADMHLAVELSERIYFDPREQMIGVPVVGSGGDKLFDYRSFPDLTEYVRKYYGNISSICIYVYPGTVDHVDNRYFRLITDTIREKKWYINTMRRPGIPSWSYLTDLGTGRRSIRLTRVLYTKEYRVAGIISISIDPTLTYDFVNGLDGYAYMTLNGDELVHSNFELKDGEMAAVYDVIEKKRTEEFNFRDENSFLSYVRITPRYSEDYYDVIVIRPYDEIVAAIRGSAALTIIPLLGGAFVMAMAIILLNSWFSRRITALGKAMHKVVEKDYDTAGTGIGDAKDEIYDVYTDMNKMVQDMQSLTEAAAEERVQKEQLYSRQKDVEFKMLATQINPHFLYNTLENIRMLAMINKEKEIEDISVRLTRLLRSSLEAGSELKTLAWEMDKVDCYLKIQEYRFGDRITAELHYDPETAEKYLIMPFVVQPFVENAYVHAMEDMDEGGAIDISVEIEENLKLLIHDNGQGMSEDKLEAIRQAMSDFENLDRTHIGLANVNQRIKLRFGEQYGVTIDSKENEGTTVQILMPLVPADTGETE